MLEKTLAMIAGIPSATYVPDEERVYDEEEIRALAHVLNHLVYGPSQIRKALQRHGVSVVPANFYSAIPLVEDLEDSFVRAPVRFDRIFDETILRDTLELLSPLAKEFDPPAPAAPGHFSWTGPFSHADAPAYYAMVRRYQPRTVLEIGSGASTIVALAAMERNGAGRMVCIDPFTNDYLDIIAPKIGLYLMRAQEIEVEWMNDMLQDGDFLFIDSTHTVKHDSDCIHIYLRLLPGLRRNVFVHAHDISLPHTHALGPMREHQVHWSEQYLLYAYLLGNARTSVVYGSAWHATHNHERLAQIVHREAHVGGASIWFRQSAG